MNRITDFQKELKKEILYNEPVYISPTYSKLSLYNPDINFPLQKFWFHLTQVKIYNNNKKNTDIEIILSNSEMDKNFIEYIDILDIKICDVIKKMKNNKKLQKKKSYVKKTNLPPILNLKVPISGTKIFDEDNNNINITDIDISNNDITVAVIIELSDILITDDDYWINYTIKQMKIKNHNENLFDVLENNNNFIKKENNYINYNTNNKPQIKLSNNNINNNNNTNKIAPFIVSTNDILNQLNKMKEKKNKLVELDNIVEPDNNINMKEDIKNKLVESDNNINMKEDMKNKLDNMFNEMKIFQQNLKKTDEKFKMLKLN
jgi:hypothetical protein